MSIKHSVALITIVLAVGGWLLYYAPWKERGAGVVMQTDHPAPPQRNQTTNPVVREVSAVVARGPTNGFDVSKLAHLTDGFDGTDDILRKVANGAALTEDELRTLIANSDDPAQLQRLMERNYQYSGGKETYIKFLELAEEALTRALGQYHYSDILADAYCHGGLADQLFSLARKLKAPQRADYDNEMDYRRAKAKYGGVLYLAAMQNYSNSREAAEWYMSIGDTEFSAYLEPFVSAATRYHRAGDLERAIEVLTMVVNLPPEVKYKYPDAPLYGVLSAQEIQECRNEHKATIDINVEQARKMLVEYTKELAAAKSKNR